MIIRRSVPVRAKHEQGHSCSPEWQWLTTPRMAEAIMTMAKNKATIKYMITSTYSTDFILFLEKTLGGLF